MAISLLLLYPFSSVHVWVVQGLLLLGPHRFVKVPSEAFCNMEDTIAHIHLDLDATSSAVQSGNVTRAPPGHF